MVVGCNDVVIIESRESVSLNMSDQFVVGDMYDMLLIQVIRSLGSCLLTRVDDDDVIYGPIWSCQYMLLCLCLDWETRLRCNNIVLVTSYS